MYSYKELSQGYYVLSLDNHVEIMEALAAFCGEKNILAGEISGLGATNDATFRYLKTFAEQMEITNLIGNISEKDGKPYLHVHVTASRSDYSCIGGHLLSARINGACELIVKTFPEPIHRRHDPTTGLNMYQL